MKYAYVTLAALVMLFVACAVSYWQGAKSVVCPDYTVKADSAKADLLIMADSLEYWKAVADTIAADTIEVQPTSDRTDAAKRILDGTPVDSLMRLHSSPK